jgi:hypothetical protein
MATFAETLSKRWQDVVSLVLGVWLVVSPWALGYAGETMAAWNAYIFGVIIAVAAIAALVAFHEWEEWVNAVIGLWLIVSPWVLGFSGLAAAMWNFVAVGVIVAVLAAWAAYMARQEPAHAR